MDRKPIVAGRFYTDNPQELKNEVEQYTGPRKKKSKPPYDKLVMLPHAGYVFSGGTCGKTLAEVSLAPVVILLGPNHTGLGAPLSVWSTGCWNFPGGKLDVDEGLAAQLLESGAGFVSNEAAHSREHSLEVLIPFLHHVNPATKIVPVCVSESAPRSLKKAGEALAEIIERSSKPVSIVVSSDMSHFITAEMAKKLDSIALEAVIRMDPEGFYSAVSTNNISMCGVLPMTLGMYAVQKNGAVRGKLLDYTNSGKVTGDYESVVAYAGVIIS
ncbi:AmmeMemoRadiSam system protein B [Maridesulfovibrio ferrireducens]|uniref:AmmeMemoRadiSam system protein B n=1 Tax=Maridesulfovibrio ferrireducens TaxID=246191 RepID=UPI001A1D0C07|nr:AmmeMemoRadiSam system protein B [Maridesulfovibrio ferrireducens]MBI9112631.1 AmmeMemoRadiSam system protein B [Maridesulfovibrio ferrireducens]